MNKKKCLTAALALALLLSGCGGKQTAAQENVQPQRPPAQNGAQSDQPPMQGGNAPSFPGGEDFAWGEEAVAEEVRETVVIDTADLFSDRDFETDYAEKKSAVISLKGTSASCASDAVRIDGTIVTILDEGTYILSGTLEDGQIIVDADKKDKTQLVLDGVSIHSAASAPIYVRQADKVFITLAEGSKNTLSNGGTFSAIDENKIDAAVFSKDDITLNGTGSLTIDSPAGHGIVGKDSLTVTGGTYQITAASHGLDGKDDVCIAGGTFAITAGKDGVHAEHDEDLTLGYLYVRGGTFDITAEGDGLSASASVQIDDGTFRITSGGGSANAPQKASGFGGGRHGGTAASSAVPAEGTADTTVSGKGIKGAAGLFINGGSFTVDAADDALHSNTDAAITGGTFTIASGDDGIHADQTLTVTAGTIDISKCYEGLEGLHIDISGGDIRAKASDDGLNAAGGRDSSGFGGFFGGDRFGGRGGMPGNMGAMPAMPAEKDAVSDVEEHARPDKNAMPAPGKGGMGGAGVLPGGRSDASAGNDTASNDTMPAMPGGGSGSIRISGGTICLDAGGDCIDANGTLEITGGTVTVCSAMKGDTSVLDFDRSATISGGTFVGSGSAMMAQTFSDSEQGVITVRLGSTQKAGTEIQIKDAEGNVVFRYAPEQDYYYLIISTPGLVKGETYSLTAGGFSRTLKAD